MSGGLEVLGAVKKANRDAWDQERHDWQELVDVSPETGSAPLPAALDKVRG